jgi:hypothetical protein
MDPKENRERVIKDAKCALILNAAKKLFDAKGYWETRLEDIAADVGFSKASLYNYYPDKESLFLSLAIRTSRKCVQEGKHISYGSRNHASHNIREVPGALLILRQHEQFSEHDGPAQGHGKTF